MSERVRRDVEILVMLLRFGMPEAIRLAQSGAYCRSYMSHYQYTIEDPHPAVFQDGQWT